MNKEELTRSNAINQVVEMMDDFVIPAEYLQYFTDEELIGAFAGTCKESQEVS